MKHLSVNFILCFLVCLTPLWADVPTDSVTSYQWIRALSDQNDPNLSSEILTLTTYYVSHFLRSKKNSEILQIQGNIYLKNKKYQKAFGSFLKQLTVYPDSSRDYNSINALLLLSLKDKKIAPNKSIIRYWLTSDSPPNSFKKKYLLYIQRLFMLNLPQTDRIALQEIDWLLSQGFVKFNLDELLYEKAKILTRNKKTNKAFNTYLELMKDWPHSPYFPNALYYVGDYYQNSLKNKSLALRLFGQFVQRYPNHSLAALAHLHLAEIYDSAIQRPKLAVQEYVKFINRSNDNALVADAYYQIAQIYEKELGNRTVAIALYEKILRRYPKSKIALKAHRSLKNLLKK